MSAHSGAGPDVPDGTSPDAESCPSPELIASWLGSEACEVEPTGPGEGSTVPSDDPPAQAQARHFRDVLGHFASGVTVVTAMSGGEPVGMTCQSFSSVSLDPPLVLFVPAKTSRAWPLIEGSGRFCVNVLADGQAELANRMASREADKFAEVAWHPSEATGSPVLEGALAHVDCSVHAVHEAGDHWVVIGRVLHLASVEAHPEAGPAGPGGHRDPLLFYRGQYRTTR